jgi:Leucine-rich repeat (LRR) protein
MKTKFLFITLICCAFAVKNANAQSTTQFCCTFEDRNIVSDLETALQTPDLEILDLSMQSPKLTKVPEQLGALTKLKCIDLSYNRIATFSESFKKLVNLECIDLSGNHYLQKLPAFLNDMPNLKVIRIGELKWTDAKKKEVEQSFPKISFIW